MVIKEDKLKQLNLKFKGHPLVDTRFRKYTVNLYHGPGDKVPTVVSGVWAINPKQAIVKAIQRIRGNGFSMRDSRAYPQRG